jgi:DNA-binding response OmpR family regulator
MELKPTSQTTAIVIDDDHDSAIVFAEYLEFFGVTILAIGHDGKSAVELYHKFKPEIVFLDVMMPSYDGFYGLEKIKQFDSSAKIIMVTADSRLESAIKLREQGAQSIIYKPFEVQEVLAAINKAIHFGVVNS